MSKKIIFYLPELFADWEGAFLLPELREVKKDVVVVSETGNPVQSIGKLTVSVDASLDSVNLDDIEGLILIGSDSWPDPKLNKSVLVLAKQLYHKGILVAGICAATVAMAKIGLLEEKKHTSNDLEFLKKYVPSYHGEKNFQEKLAVRDGNLITAPGIAPIEFTLEVMNYYGIYSEAKRKQWFAMFKNGVKPPKEFWTSP